MNRAIASKLIVPALFCIFVHTAYSSQAAGPTYVTFDAPGVGTYPGSLTVATGIDSNGDSDGYFNDENGAVHGFVRTAAGVVAVIDGPNAVATSIFGMSPSGVAVGQYIAAEITHGFTRDLSGNFTTVDVPGASSTSVSAINSSGEITGASTFGGFVRFPGGAFSIFSVPGAISTYPVAINDSGEVAGNYQTRMETLGAFILDTNGVITAFEAPKAVPTQGTYAAAISASGAVLGHDYRVSGQLLQYAGYERTPNGHFLNLTVPGQDLDLTPTAINNRGTITGYYYSLPGVSDGFLRDQAGNFNTVNIPMATTTNPYCINAAGQIAGGYVDSTYEFTHAFIRTP